MSNRNSNINENNSQLIAELSLQYGDASLVEKQDFEKLIFDVASVQSNARVVDELIDSFKNVETVKEFEDKYTQKRANSKCNVRSTNQYKEWMKKVNAILNSTSSVADETRLEDEDFQMTSEISDIDPITKKRMETPMKNKICGHYYEKDSILGSISVNPRFKCPVVGCSNREMIRISSLEEDLNFKLRLRRTK